MLTSEGEKLIKGVYPCQKSSLRVCKVLNIERRPLWYNAQDQTINCCTKSHVFIRLRCRQADIVESESGIKRNKRRLFAVDMDADVNSHLAVRCFYVRCSSSKALTSSLRCFPPLKPHHTTSAIAQHQLFRRRPKGSAYPWNTHFSDEDRHVDP